MGLPNFIGTDEPFARVFLSDQWSDERLAKMLVMAKLDKVQEQKPLLGGRLKNLGDIRSVEPMWMEEVGYPTTLTCTLSGSGTTLTVTGKIFNTTASRVNMLKVIRANGVLRYDAAGVTSIAKVTAVDAALPVLTVEADSGTVMPSDGTGQVWKIVGEPRTDAENAPDPRFLTRYFRYATSEIFSDTFEIEKTRAVIAMEGGIDEVEHQVDSLTKRLGKQIDISVVNQYPVISGGLPQSMKKEARPRLCGLTWWPQYLFGTGGAWENPEILKDLGNVALDKDHLDNLAIAMDDNGSDWDGQWELWVYPPVKDYIHDYGWSQRRMTAEDKGFGYLVDEVTLKRPGRSFKVMGDRHIPRGMAILLKIDNAGTGFIAEDHIDKGELPALSLGYRRWEIRCQKYGVILREAPISIGVIKNIAI